MVMFRRPCTRIDDIGGGDSSASVSCRDVRAQHSRPGDSFLQRPELAGLWDHRILIDTDLAVARHRGTARDARRLGGLAKAESMYDVRYHAAARRYLAAVDPAGRATLIVENTDLEYPRLRTGAAPDTR
jgi:hypothetical protein